MDLVLLRVRAWTSCSRRASRRRSTPQRSSSIHTDSSSPFHNSLASALAPSLSVFARALLIPVSSGLTTITRSTCGSRIRATSHALPVTSNATPIRRLKALSQRLDRLRSARHPTRRADHPVLADRDHTEITMNIQTDRTTNPPQQQRHLSPPHRRQRAGEPAGRTTQTDTSSQLNPRKSQGRPNEKHGLETHRQKRPTRLRSPKKGPCPGSTDAKTGAGRTLQAAFSCREYGGAASAPARCTRRKVSRGARSAAA